MNVLSLFSGIGGLELGLERAGMTVVGQVEIDEFCQRVLAKHWPEVPRHDDVRTAVEWWNGDSRPTVDLVCGGFPCQPVSVAGRGLAQADGRWGWPWFRDVVAALEPRHVLIENVPGLVRRGLLDVLRDLADLGFDARWDRYPAAAFGAPHLRWRLFLAAAHSERVELREQSWWSGGSLWSSATVAGFDGATWAVADAGSLGRDRGEGVENGRRSASLGCEAGSHPGDSRLAPLAGAWTAEPGICPVADGLPGRLARPRLKAFGNAVVPQIAEHVGHLILADAVFSERAA